MCARSAPTGASARAAALAGRAGPTTYIPSTIAVAVAVAADLCAGRRGRFVEVRRAQKKCRMRVREATCMAVARPAAAAAAAALPGPRACVTHDSPRPVCRVRAGCSAVAAPPQRRRGASSRPAVEAAGPSERVVTAAVRLRRRPARAALVAAAVGSFTGGFKRGNDSLSRATIAECALGVLLALPILPNLVYLPLGGLFLAFVKLSFAAGRKSLDLIESTATSEWRCCQRLEALAKTAAAATKPAISWLAPLGSLELSSGMSMVVQGLAYTETSVSTLAGGLACVLGCLALSPLVAYGTWAAEQGRLEPDYDVEASTVDAVQARLWILWLLVVAMPVLLFVDEHLAPQHSNRRLNILLTIYAIPFLLALGFAIFFTSQDDSFIESIVLLRRLAHMEARAGLLRRLLCVPRHVAARRVGSASLYRQRDGGHGRLDGRSFGSSAKGRRSSRR